MRLRQFSEELNEILASTGAAQLGQFIVRLFDRKDWAYIPGITKKQRAAIRELHFDAMIVCYNGDLASILPDEVYTSSAWKPYEPGTKVR